jgi:hypothetical protein
MRALAAVVVAGALFVTPAARAVPPYPPPFDVQVCTPGAPCDTLCKTTEVCVPPPDPVCVAGWCHVAWVCIHVSDDPQPYCAPFGDDIPDTDVDVPPSCPAVIASLCD